MAHDHHDHVDDEMHELNEEADYLENKVVVDANGVNGHKIRPPPSGNNDPDAQAQVIESLRSQVQDLFSQVTQLNGKLVRSYDRVSDLEDELHVTSSNLRNCTIKVGQLELERTQHLSALSTGLLVEKSHVTSELTRLMEKATEEAARAGQAENARNAIEKELDDLSAGLFDQANRMVAEARFARAQSERKVEETERALKGAEEIVGVLQAQMQALQAEKENADKRVEEIRALMGKGKWVDRPVTSGRSERMRLLCLHAPYTEYVQFIVHLRTIRPSTANPPPITTLLPLPFLARLVVEDSDPTVRLDMAPSLNWLSRRSVISAIHAGQLTIEPMSTTTLLEELSAASSIPGNSHNTHVTCALCGTSIIEPPTSPNRATSFPMSPARTLSGGKGTWSPAFLKNSLQSITASPFTQSSRPTTPTVQVSMEPPDHVFIFRLENTSSGGISVSIPLTSPQPPAAQRPPTIYPLCASGWCLARLRTTCSLWSFIRTSVVEKVWEEEPHPAASTNLSLPKRQPSDSDAASQETVASKQTIQPKRSRMGIGALWGSMSRTLSGVPKEAERAESPKPKEETVNGNMNKPVPPVPPRRMPPPPPQHPPLAAPVPRPAAAAGPPPPLPKRNRQRTASPQPQDKPAADAATPAEEKTGLLSPPEEEEAFKTPVEEIAAPTLTRPMTPSAIPLPPSVPATPVHAPLERPAAPATPPPIRLSDDRPPSRSGSPVPPPLPRRAAGRARPTSLALVSGPETEAGAAGEAKPDGPVAEEASKEAEPEHPKPVEKIEEAAEETEEPESAAAPAVEEQPHNSSTSDVSAVHESEKVSLQDVPLATDSERETDNPHENANEGDSKALKVDGTGSPESMSVSERSAEDDPRLYVGEGTWEERAWRELVKLREEMFWARVGGVR